MLNLLLLLSILSPVQGQKALAPFKPEPGYTRPANRVSGNKALKIMCVRVSFSNDTDPSVSRHSEEDMKKVGDQLNEFFKIQSYGMMSVEKFEVSPVITLRESNLYEVEDSSGKETERKGRRSIASDAIAAMQKQFNRNIRTEFDTLCFVVNASPTKGRLVRRGVAAYASGPQNCTFFTPSPGWKVFSHEIGHTFGFPHAWSLDSKKKEFSLPENGDRQYAEYGDAVSPMGKGANSYSIVERYRMGWVGSSEGDTRYVKKFDPGSVSFMAYDRPDAVGLVGGYLEGDFGVLVTELVSKRDEPKDDQEVPEPATDAGPSRLWLSVISRGNFTGKEMPDLRSPILIAQLSSLTPPSKGAKRPTTTVMLDLTPTGKEIRNQAMLGKGLEPGQTGSVRLKDGRTMTIKFVSYDSAKHIAKVETAFSSASR